MSCNNYLSIGSDNLLQLLGLQDGLTKAYISTATVTAVVKDKDGVAITTAIVLDFVAGSQGDYVGTLPDTTVLVDGDLYFFEALADDGPGRARTFRKAFLAGYTN